MALPVRSDPAAGVASYYDANTRPFYLERWHPEDIHFGLWGPPDDTRDHFAAVKRMTEVLVAPASIGDGEFVVDAGCGVGGAAIDVAASTGARVLGLTISPVQVEIATRRALDAGVADQARFEKADCSDALPCDDASVDAVLTIEAACHFADKRRFLAECRRVLKPGGRLVGSDWMQADACKDETATALLDPVCAAWRLAGLESPAAWKGMLEEAGFRVDDCEDLGAAVQPNIRFLARGRLDLQLEVANRSRDAETAALWTAQYDSLIRAWSEGAFTIGRWSARCT